MFPDRPSFESIAGVMADPIDHLKDIYFQNSPEEE